MLPTGWKLDSITGVDVTLSSGVQGRRERRAPQAGFAGVTETVSVTVPVPETVSVTGAVSVTGSGVAGRTGV